MSEEWAIRLGDRVGYGKTVWQGRVSAIDRFPEDVRFTVAWDWTDVRWGEAPPFFTLDNIAGRDQDGTWKLK